MRVFFNGSTTEIGKLRRSIQHRHQWPVWAEGMSRIGSMVQLAFPLACPHLLTMDLIYPINFAGHDDWMHSGYEPKLARGDVITRDGEVLGCWRAVGYDHKDEYSSGRFEFILNREDVVKFTENFAMLDVRTSRGFALSSLTRTIREWYEVNEK